MDSSAGEPFSPSNTSDINYPIPKDRYLEPIRYNSNPATIPGIMYDIHQWIARTGHFKTLLEHRAVALSNGALAIDQTDSIQFIDKQLLRAEQHDFFNPCPATEIRIANYNIKQATYPRPTPYTPTNTPVPKEQSRNYVVSSHKVDDQLRMLMSSMAHVFEDRDAAHAMACASMLTPQASNISIYLCGGPTTIPSTRAPRSELITLMSPPRIPPSFGSSSLPRSQLAKPQS